MGLSILDGNYHAYMYMTAATHMNASTLGRVTVAINTAKLHLKFVYTQAGQAMYTYDLVIQ